MEGETEMPDILPTDGSDPKIASKALDTIDTSGSGNTCDVLKEKFEAIEKVGNADPELYTMIYNDETVYQKQLQEFLNEEKDSDSFLLYKESIEVLMHAELMVADDFVLPDDVDEDVGETKDEQTKFRVKPKKNEAFPSTTMAPRTNVDGVTWRKKHDLAATRQLQCTFAHTKRKLL